MDRRRRALLGSLAGLTALSGCQFGQSSTATATPSLTPAPAPTPTEGLSVSWRTGPDVPERRTQTTAVALDGRLYVIGGIVEDVERQMAVYHPEEE